METKKNNYTKKINYYTVYIEDKENNDEVYLLEDTDLNIIKEKLKKYNILDKTTDQIKNAIAKRRSIQGIKNMIHIYKNLDY